MNNIFSAADILLPKQGTDMKKWAVLACDQYTSEPDYWNKAEGIVRNSPSMLRLILPEIYLEYKDVNERVEQIHDNMRTALDDVLTLKMHGFVYVERETQSGIRCGIVGAVDLEAYSYDKNTQPLVRPTENTVVERIPPRLAVRRGAMIEAPHILMLIDDDKQSLIEPYEEKKKDLEMLYDTELMLGGGHIKGYAITSAEDIAHITNTVQHFADKDYFARKYPNAKADAPLALAVGDGNHSLATAKAYWEEIKPTLTVAQQSNHPARYCLVELVNIHSSAINIEPIHRVLFGADEGSLLLEAAEYLSSVGAKFCPYNENLQHFISVAKSSQRSFSIINPPCALATGTLDAFLSIYIKTHKEVSVDYVHDEASVRELAAKGHIGFILPPFAKSDIFKGVLLGGVLPKKTFSMGTAPEKRYYMEARRITI
ncbi:MAG: DUF1015 domain-containing protein [Oscillospiraceae bacterium]